MNESSRLHLKAQNIVACIGAGSICADILCVNPSSVILYVSWGLRALRQGSGLLPHSDVVGCSNAFLWHIGFKVINVSSAKSELLCV